MSVLDKLISATLSIVPRPIVGYFSRRYIAGETVEEALQTARELGRQGAMATMDILGEFIRSLEEAEQNTREYVALIHRIHQEKLPETNVSVKLSALGLLLDEEACLSNLRRLLQAVEEIDSFLRIDMEDSPCTDATLRLYRRLREEFPGRVGVVLQARLRRTAADIEALAGPDANFRLCKGIYLEPEEIAFTEDEPIRRNFTALLDRILASGAYVGIATHDTLLVEEAIRLIRKHRVPREKYEFQMLLGVTEDLRRRILETGHRLRVYIPYGSEWYAYSVRRLRENPRIAGYAFKALFLRR